jgi:hypothetical protein
MRYYYILIAVLLAAATVQTQPSLGVNFNVDRQPAWGAFGDVHAEYYYLPDIETYYNISQHVFYYNDGGYWVGRSVLPSRYRDYDLYYSYKVVVNEREPYLNHHKYKNQYPADKGRYDQQLIRDNRDQNSLK